jgi:hypothetical protein
MYHDEGYFILGTTERGSRFRPSDWVDRIATAYGSFAGQRIQYHPQIAPATYEGQRCLFVASDLLEQDADSFNFIMDFAHSNQLQVVAPHADLYHSAA